MKWSAIGRGILASVMFMATINFGFVTRVAAAGTPYPFLDNVENLSANNWLGDSPWARTNADYYSANTSWTDSPGGYYANNLNISLTLATAIDLGNATRPQLKFWHHYQLEPGFDWGYVEISTNGGATWVNPPLASYSGTTTMPFISLRTSPTKSDGGSGTLAQEPWKLEQLDLTGYAGQSNVKIRFRLQTDESQNRDGWSIDDIAIAELPPAVTLNPVANVTRTSLDLSWSPSADLNFVGYRVYRGLAPGVSRTNTLLATIGSINSTFFTDTQLASKTLYYYKVYTVNAWGIYNPSTNEVSGATLVGLGYPFLDTMESGGNNWIASPSNTWTLITPDAAHSGNKAWTDSPQGNYENNISATLTLADFVEVNPLSQLTGWVKGNIAAGDYLFAEMSTDNGLTWNEIVNSTSINWPSWVRNQTPLGNYTGPAKIRFRLVTDGSLTADGIYIDDVSVSNLPDAVTLAAPVPQEPPNRALLTWSKSPEALFKSYMVYRASAAGVFYGNATLIATITNPNTVSYMDTGLTPGATYYYRVYVMNTYDAANGSNERSVLMSSTVPGGVVSYPYFDNMESGAGNWNPGAPWGLTNSTAHSGNYSWTDSPLGGYANSANVPLTLSIDLRTAQMPVLSFWQQYTLQTNSDWGYIDVSTDGVNWNTIFFVTGNSAWREEKVDLTEYALFDNVRIRFRLNSDSSGIADGWYIDDVRIAETATPTIAFPFADDMEIPGAGNTNWQSSSWEPDTPGHSGTYAWKNSSAGVTPQNTNSKLTLAGTIDLGNATHPQLTFWHKYFFNYYYNYGYVQISTGKGIGTSYSNLWSLYNSRQDGWSQVQLDLTPYAGLHDVRIRFFFVASYTPDTWWVIDDVRIAEAPVDVVLATPANVTRHGADLSWTRNNDTDFDRYEIYRGTTSSINRSSTLVATVTNQTATTFSDVYSILEPGYYYYRIYVYNNKGAVSLGGNVVQAVYPVIPKQAYPFYDDVESGTGDWDWGAPWGITNATSHSGNFSWTDSPTGNYANNANSALEMVLDLRTAQMPVLSFWQQNTLQTNSDYGYVDVSIDGTNWNTIYFVTGNSAWREEKIDLTEYAVTDFVRIRFRLVSDASGTADGWYIDDIKVAETVSPSIAYPFFDDMGNATATDAAWLSSSWELNNPGHGDTYAWGSNAYGQNPSGSNSKLTLAGTIDLGNATHPQLTFWQKYYFNYYYNTGYVQISTSKGLGTSYSNLWSLSNSRQDGWVQQQIDLTPYAGLHDVRIRFFFAASNSPDTWWVIDDVRIEEAPVDVVLAPPANVSQHGVELSWTRNIDANFVRYEVHRDTSASVSLASPLMATITSQGTTAFTDIILTPANYYYRVYIYNDKGAHSLGSNIVQAIYSPMAVKSYPFYDDMENGTGNWDWTAPWGLTEAAAHSGNRSWTDSPVGGYANNANTALNLSIDLRNAVMPVLSFWHQYTLQTNSDYGYVDVSTDGTNWNTIYFVTGSSAWKEERIDLTEYAVFENVRIRFRLWADGSGTADGWYIDDVRIAETVTPTMSYPFFDDMESATATNANWLSSSWERNTPGHSGTYYWGNNVYGVTPSGTNSRLTTAGTFDLTGAVHPQLTFWHKYNFSYYYNTGYVQISSSKGLSTSYSNLWSLSNSRQDGWVQQQIDLTPYAGLNNIRIRFFFAASNEPNTWWSVDDVRLEEAPVDVVIAAPTNVSRHSADLSWTRNMDATFVRYEIRRTSTAAVTLGSTLVATITDQASTAFTDTYSVLEPTNYYYRVYVFNDKGTSSLGSNIVQAIYPLPPRQSYPFFDDMESGTGKWDWGAPWGLSGSVAHSGTHSWTDSPTGNYANGVNIPLELNIDMRTAQMPVLSFWQQYTLQTNSDWGYIDVSIDGVNWNTVFFVTGNSAWRQEKIDLTEYAVYDNVRIRFRLVSDTDGNTADGWYIDDVRIAETTTPAVGYPFFDDMENNANAESNWQSSSWEPNTPGHSGTYAWRNSPTGTTPSGTNAKLTLAGTIDLGNAVHPQLTFWHKYYFNYYYNYGYVQISSSKGIGNSYSNLLTLNNGRQDGWVQRQIDLTPYVGLNNIRIRFFFAASNEPNTWWEIDDVRIDELDNTAPGAIVSLSASNPTANSMRLTWLAPGDDAELGQAWQYDVRYSTSPITTANFNAATQCANVPRPQPHGMLETFTVNGLTPFTTYYFAVKTADEVPNWSNLSNVVSATTFQSGVVLVTVDAPRNVLTNRTFTARIRLDNVKDFDAANYNLTFDPAVLQFVNATAGDIGGTVVPVDGTNVLGGTLSVTQNIPGTVGASGPGYLADVTFYVLGAPGAASAITPANCVLGDITPLELPSYWTGDTVNVKSVLPGDANGDEKVNALDITKVERIIISLDAATSGADANGDGKINALDITKVERIILGLD